MISADLLRMAADPHYHTPDPAEVKDLADKIDAAIQRVHAVERRVRWLETQVHIQAQGARRVERQR